MKVIVLLSLFAACVLSAPLYFDAVMSPQDPSPVPISPKMEPTSRDQEKIFDRTSGNSTSPLEEEGSGETSGEEKEEVKEEDMEEEREEDNGSSSSSESIEKRSKGSQEKKGSPPGGSDEIKGSEESTMKSVDETTQEVADAIIYDNDQLPPRV